MLSVVVCDDSGRTLVSGPQLVAGHFIAAPIPAVITDAHGFASGAFTNDPISAKQTDEFGFASSVFYAHPVSIVETDARGYSNGSGQFIGQPISIVFV